MNEHETMSKDSSVTGTMDSSIHSPINTPSMQKNNWATPVAIVIAGLLIGGAIYLDKTSPSQAPSNGGQAQQTGDIEKIRTVTKDDHIRGNINAPVIIVEYSDTQCPFCKGFHNTMKEIYNEYSASGKVAWVYRHFPLDNLHAKARKESVALECAAEQNKDSFWTYADRLYEVTGSNDRLDVSELPKIAAYVGLDVSKFNTCLASGKFDKKIKDDELNAQATGGRGTPWSIVIGKNGKKYPLSGAQPAAAIKQLIDVAAQGK